MHSMFNEAKTAQMAAYLLRKTGGRMNYMKLLKLLYLADRESMKQTGDSMSHDLFYSLPYGPVLSRTLELLQGQPGASWQQLIAKHDYDAELAPAGRDTATDDLDELSPRNCTILDQVFAQFGGMSERQLVDWTHNHCDEWADPHGSNRPIRSLDIFQALGWPEPQAREMAQAFDERRCLEQAMVRYN